jgi:hypothetical protein
VDQKEIGENKPTGRSKEKLPPIIIIKAVDTHSSIIDTHDDIKMGF